MMHAIHVANAAKEIERLPEDNESIHAIMRGNFHGWDLVPAVLKLSGSIIEKLYVATLGFNAKNTAELLKFLDDGRVGFCRFLCSCYFKDSSPAEFEQLREGLSARGMRAVAARTHAKILAMQLVDGRFIVVETSANLRSCRNIEQFCMTQSRELFEFHASWMDEIAETISQEK